MPYRLRNASADYRTVDKAPSTNPVLAENMKRLMNGRSIEAVRALMAEAGFQIGTGTLHRALKGETGNRLESLEKIAQFFSVSIDQLLLPQGDDLQPIYSEEASSIAAELDALTAEQRTEMVRLFRQTLNLVRDRTKPPVVDVAQSEQKKVAGAR
jgi:transcriptional regulator with XRE-family HTH domain